MARSVESVSPRRTARISIWFCIVFVVAVLAGVLSCAHKTTDQGGDDPVVNPYEKITVADFPTMTIDRGNPCLKEYKLNNVETLANEYYANDLQWVFGCGVNWKILDENYVPVLYEIPGVVTRNINQICHFAFGFYKYYHESGDERYRTYFFNNVHWLMNHADENGYLFYPYKWNHGSVVYNEPWLSGMAQGEAVAVMCMAYRISGEKKYLDMAELFFKRMYSNTGGHWVFGVDTEGYYWLEEYPSSDFCHVLNGKLIGLWGLWDYYVITRDTFALTLFQAGIKSIVDHMTDYNLPKQNCSRYCMHYTTCNPSYHQIHLDLFRYYDQFFGIPAFAAAPMLFAQ